ncbi:MAG: [FeFe] hydrogenase H-cluster radical SAM maturase HydE [Phycisphaerales bacterium]|jgi:biotin synthase|nr:[FeFe] hydrogenase H-cluster radical SAM maturase HydE [Phycisphaerales bacterium]
MDHKEILRWLRQDDPQALEELWARADKVRQENVGQQVHLRGLIEIGNYCVRRCAYCGLNAGRKDIPRYRMTKDEILACAAEAVEYKYGSVVIQAGEDPFWTLEFIADLVGEIKASTPLAVTLSLGERSDEELAAWRAAGADRYLLRFETSNRELFDHIHPPLAGLHSDRPAMLGRMAEMGYEIGSGVMVGIPGQTYEDLACDVEMFADLDLDMIGLGPYISHPDTPLGVEAPAESDQTPASEELTYRMLALARLACPQANIPSTSALATLNLAQGRELGLIRGANIVMPNLTPQQYRPMYEIYPAKACIRETAQQCRSCMKRRIESLGRTVGDGAGASPNYIARHAQESGDATCVH